ncbi:alpha-L-fucosidase [Verrucomicrobiota bacterium]
MKLYSMQSVKNTFIAVIFLLLVAKIGWSEPNVATGENQQYEHMKWWENARFGVFIHWGPCALKNTEISWGRFGDRPGKGKATQGVPAKEYDNLYKKFNPVKFNAKEWVRMIKDSGARYLIFTTKHHDGFCMFDTSQRDYKITKSPFGRDITKELADACHEAGVKIFWYYSQPDWTHPDYLTDNHKRYVKYLHEQVRELLTNYGKIDGVWFDGLGMEGSSWNSEELDPMIRELQPGIIINSRIARELPGDFDTPEGRVGCFQIDRPWETCMSIHSGWSFRENSKVKSLKDCIRVLVRCAGNGGNLALNFGPAPDGSIPAEVAKRYLAIGKWLKKYGESIYGTTGGPWVFCPTDNITSTRNGNKIYLHILQKPPKGSIELHGFDKKIVGHKVLTGGKAWVRQTHSKITIKISPEHFNPTNTIVMLKLDGDALSIPPISNIEKGAVSIRKNATSSPALDEDHNASKAFDNDLTTYWKGKWHDPSYEDTAGWIEVDLGWPVDIDRIAVYGGDHGVQNYELQYKKDEKWKTFHKGKKPDGLNLKVNSVKARHVRLYMEYLWKPNIYEFQVFEKQHKGRR